MCVRDAWRAGISSCHFPARVRLLAIPSTLRPGSSWMFCSTHPQVSRKYIYFHKKFALIFCGFFWASRHVLIKIHEILANQSVYFQFFIRRSLVWLWHSRYIVLYSVQCPTWLETTFNFLAIYLLTHSSQEIASTRTHLIIKNSFRHGEFPTTINCSSSGHVIQWCQWRNRFDLYWWNTRYWSDSTTA